MSLRDEHKYDDIIHLPHPVSKKHPQMPVADRAAQFSPFAALTGYEEALEETKTTAIERVENEVEVEVWEELTSLQKNNAMVIDEQKKYLFHSKELDDNDETMDIST